MTDEELRRLLASNPDIAIVSGNAQNARKDGVVRPDSTQGAKVDSQYTKAQGSRLERKFIDLWESLGCPPLEREWRFDEVRRWRADFAHPGSMTLIEIEGGTHANGRHNRAQGYADDCEKYNVATLGGWQVYRLTANMITAEWCNRIADAIRTTEGMK